MNRALQVKLSKMTFGEFRLWHSNTKNADLLPMFFNDRWLAAQKRPVYTIYKTTLKWVEKHPLPD